MSDELTGTLMSFRPQLFQFAPRVWLALDKVVTVRGGTDLLLDTPFLTLELVNAKVFTTNDVDVISRFWEFWEQV